MISVDTLLNRCLKRGARLDLSMDEFKCVCRILYERHYHELLGVYAKAALNKTDRENPLFIFYLVYAQHKGGKKRISGRTLEKLENAFDRALDRGDKTTADMIENFIMNNFPVAGFSGMNSGFLQSLQGMFGEDFEERVENGDFPDDEEMEQILGEIMKPKNNR